ncbi:putative Insect cuticle protein domain-containing protein 18, partial [Homarus americanus]
IVVILLLGRSYAGVIPVGDIREQDLPRLSTYEGYHHQYLHGSDGTYDFSFSLPQQSRWEHRDGHGQITGSFAYVDKIGHQVLVRYTAGKDGYHPQVVYLPVGSDAIERARRS